LERIIIGLQVTIIGMSVVFLILILINLALNLMHMFFSRAEPSKKAPATTEGATTALDQDPDQGRLIAVLTAAILATGETTAPFRTLSVRALEGKGSAWKENARRSHLRGKTLIRSRPKHALH
jgi:sodium pump decarboxylase gamma subunit